MPCGTSDSIVDEPVPELVALPGFLVIVHVPLGKPFSLTLPVGVLQVG